MYTNMYRRQNQTRIPLHALTQHHQSVGVLVTLVLLEPAVLQQKRHPIVGVVPHAQMRAHC